MASTRGHFVCVILSFFASATATDLEAALPHISTSVDKFRCVCPGETVYLTCFARGSWSHSWSSQDYFGQNTVIRFSQDYDRPGKGKLVSLPDGQSSFAQMMAIDESNLQIRIPTGDLDETRVTCTNYFGAAVTRTFIHSRERPLPPTFLQPTFIAENTIAGIKVYRFSWELPESIDIKDLKFQLDNESSITLANTSTEITIPLSYGEHNVSIVVVNRCSKDSETIALQLDVIKGAGYIELTHHKDESEKSSGLIHHNSSTGIASMFNISYFMLSLLFVFILYIG